MLGGVFCYVVVWMLFGFGWCYVCLVFDYGEFYVLFGFFDEWICWYVCDGLYDFVVCVEVVVVWWFCFDGGVWVWCMCVCVVFYEVWWVYVCVGKSCVVGCVGWIWYVVWLWVCEGVV